jgi:hypothetical protein
MADQPRSKARGSASGCASIVAEAAFPADSARWRADGLRDSLRVGGIAVITG